MCDPTFPSSSYSCIRQVSRYKGDLRKVSEPSPDKRCQLNRSMQHLITTCSDSTSFEESIRTVVLNQNLNRAFVLFELMPGNEIGLPGSYKKTLSKCCNDPLRPPDLSGGTTIRVIERLGCPDCSGLDFNGKRIL